MKANTTEVSERVVDSIDGLVEQIQTLVEKGDVVDRKQNGRKSKGPNPAQIGSRLIGEHDFISLHGSLLRYSDGCYRPAHDWVLKRAQDAFGSSSTERRCREVLFWLKTDRAMEPAEVDTAEKVSVKNGLLDWRSGEFVDHTPEHLSTVQLPVEWRPARTVLSVDGIPASRARALSLGGVRLEGSEGSWSPRGCAEGG